MTTEIQLVTELGRLHVRPQGPATAGIWIATEDFQFPRAGWNDFIIVVLDWWVIAILRLLRNDSASERVHFMDGPYAVEIINAASGKFHLRMFAGPSGGREVAIGEADVNRFTSELSDQSRKVLDECKFRGWWSVDAEQLASHLQDLDRELSLEGRFI